MSSSPGPFVPVPTCSPSASDNVTVRLPTTRRLHRYRPIQLQGLSRTSPGPDHPLDELSSLTLLRADSDPFQTAAAMLRFNTEPASRQSQPGQGRLGEQGMISSGRVIPTYSTSTVQPSRTSLGCPGPIRRTVRRKEVAEDGRRNVSSSRLLKEAQAIESNAPPGCHAAPKADDIYEWAAVIEGPSDTVYQGGTFFCNINVPSDYPFNPPKVIFQTRIYHCNINAQGEVCVDTLNDKWNSTMTIATVLQSILSLLYTCNPDDALVTSIGRQYREEPDQFEKTARIWTHRYAN